jgi:hypothetical protein
MLLRRPSPPPYDPDETQAPQFTIALPDRRPPPVATADARPHSVRFSEAVAAARAKMSIDQEHERPIED